MTGKGKRGHFLKIEEAVRRCWPDGQIEPWLRPCEVFKRIALQLEAMGCHKKEIPSSTTFKRWWADRTANAVLPI